MGIHLQAFGVPTVVERSDEIFTIDELARYLKLSKSTVYKLSQEGKIPGQKVGRHWRFRKASIDRWLEREGEEESRREAQQ